MQEMNAAEMYTNYISQELNTNNYSDLILDMKVKFAFPKCMYKEKKGNISIWCSMGALLGMSIVYICFILINGGILSFSKDYKKMAIVGMSVSVCIVVINIFLIFIGLKEKNFRVRYNKITELLKYHQVIIVEELAMYTGKTSECITKDLEKAIRQGWIQQGHFGEENNLFFKSDDSYFKYEQEKERFTKHYEMQKTLRLVSENQAEEVEKFVKNSEIFTKEIFEKSFFIKSKKVKKCMEVIKGDVNFLCYEVSKNPESVEVFGTFLNFYIKGIDTIIEKIIFEERKELFQILKLGIEIYENILRDYFQWIEMENF